MQIVKISDLKPHPKNDYFFDDMEGQKFKELKESIRIREEKEKDSGVIEPIVITQDKVIVSGHQRVRACKELVEKDSISYSTAIRVINAKIKDKEEQKKFAQTIIGDKKYTQKEMEEEIRKWKVKTSQLTQEKDEIARSKVKVEEKIVEVDKPETAVGNHDFRKTNYPNTIIEYKIAC